MKLAGGIHRVKLPAGYLQRCRTTGRNAMSADYAVWLVTVRGLRPAVVPADFTSMHLELLPADERKRWLRVSRRRYLKQKRRAA